MHVLNVFRDAGYLDLESAQIESSKKCTANTEGNHTFITIIEDDMYAELYSRSNVDRF